MSIGRRFAQAALLAVAALAAGCGQSDSGDAPCDGDQCNSVASRDELIASVAGFTDPISEFLRATVREDGTIPGDYQDILAGMSATLDCAPSRKRSFVVLSNHDLEPKSVVNHCADAPTLASEFFLLLPVLQANKDFEPRVVHMTAWDEQEGQYRRYATAPSPDGGMTINVQPTFCLNCHGGPRKLGTWQPLMNEMTNPWSQWNAEPGFRSHVFDEFMPEASARGAIYAQITAQELLDSASNFEPIVRAGIDRVTGARSQARNDAANVDDALSLLQPLFCDEQVNYVSEIHESGEFRSSVVVDDSVRDLLIALDVGDSLDFVHQDTMRIPPVANAGESNLTLVPVRGESSLRSELALVARQALDPLQALQVRSLDWSRPVGSDFRCALFDDAVERIAGGAVDNDVAALPSDATNTDLLPILLAEIMTRVAGEQRVSLAPSGDAVYSIPDATAADFANLPSVQVSPAELGTQMQQAIDGANRVQLDVIRRERACNAAARYLIAPLFPDIDC